MRRAQVLAALALALAGAAWAGAAVPPVPPPPAGWGPLEGPLYVAAPAPGFQPRWVAPGATVRVLLLLGAPEPEWLGALRARARVEVRRSAARLLPGTVVGPARAYSPLYGWTDLAVQVGLLRRVYEQGAWPQAQPLAPGR